MIRKNRIVFSIILSIAFLLSTLLFLSTILFDTKQAKAASSVEGFYMSDGAEILIAKDGAPSGIRWTANVSNSCTISDGAEFGIIIDKEPIVAVETNTTEQIIKSTATPTYENGVWTYKCGILYDDLVNALENKGITDESEIQTQLNKAYATTLYARGYAKVGEEYFYAQEGYTARTLKDVARYCLVTNDELVAGNEATFESYAGVDALTVTETAVDVKDTALLYNGSGSVSTVLDEGEYEVFFKAGKIATTTLADKGTVTTNLSALPNVPYGEHYIDYVKGNSVTRVPFIHASHKISSLSDFATFIGSYVSADSTGWYAVLTSDILNVSGTYGNNGIGHGSDKEFKGTFNGLGHKIDSNQFKNDCSYGQFGKVSGTIKNIAYTNCVLGWKTKGLTHGLLNGGVIENVYVQGKSSTENCLINFDSSNGIPGTVKNCLFDIAVATGTTTLLKYDGSETVPETSKDLAYNAVKNTYAIKSSGNGSYNLTKVGHDAPYESVEAFYNAEKNNFNADANKGFNSCWDNDFWGLSFNGISIYERTSEVLETKYLSMQSFDSNITKTEVIDLKTLLDGVTPEKVIINGVEVDASDTITLNSSDYTLGEEYRLLFGTSDKLVELPFVFVTYAISTRTEFKTFIASYDSDTSSNSWYVVLANEINMAGEVVGRSNTYGDSSAIFAGTFDGLGNRIYNMYMNGANIGGVFGKVTGTIKNTIFEGIMTGASYGLTWNVTNTGKIENIYANIAVRASNNLDDNTVVNNGSTHEKSFVGMAWEGKGYGYIINSVLNFDVIEGSTITLVKFNSAGSSIAKYVKNTYTITPNAAYDLTNHDDRDGITVYSNVSEFINNINEANGFNSYWKNDNGKLYFNENLIG